MCKDEKVFFFLRVKLLYLNWIVIGDVENIMFKVIGCYLVI